MNKSLILLLLLSGCTSTPVKERETLHRCSFLLYVPSISPSGELMYQAITYSLDTARPMSKAELGRVTEKVGEKIAEDTGVNDITITCEPLNENK